MYAIIGAQNNNEQGRLLLYQSDDVVNWTFLGEIQTNLNHFGYMWECPDYFELDGQGVILFCPQGLKRMEINIAILSIWLHDRSFKY